MMAIADTPEQCVRLFIAAHSTWEKRANARAKSLHHGSMEYQTALALAKAEYGELVSRCCAPSVICQGISFGDVPMHDPDRESIESMTETTDGVVVCTRHVGLHGIVSEYEYHLVPVSGEWRITSLRYIDQDGGCECL